MSLTTSLFPPRESLVSDIPAGDGNVANLFLQCTHSKEKASRSRVRRSAYTEHRGTVQIKRRRTIHAGNVMHRSAVRVWSVLRSRESAWIHGMPIWFRVPYTMGLTAHEAANWMEILRIGEQEY